MIATLFAIGVVLPLFDGYPIDDLLRLVTAGVLLPIWAVWLGARAPLLWPDQAGLGSDRMMDSPAVR